VLDRVLGRASLMGAAVVGQLAFAMALRGKRRAPAAE
jgi:hypothetical protein